MRDGFGATVHDDPRLRGDSHVGRMRSPAAASAVCRPQSIILLAGAKGAGKTTVANALASMFGCSLVRPGDYVRRAARHDSRAASTDEEREMMQLLRCNAEGTVLLHLEPTIMSLIERRKPICVDSIFDVADLAFFQNRRFDWRLFHVTSAPETALLRIRSRARTGDDDEACWRPKEAGRSNFERVAHIEIRNDGNKIKLMRSVAAAVEALETSKS